MTLNSLFAELKNQGLTKEVGGGGEEGVEETGGGEMEGEEKKPCKTLDDLPTAAVPRLSGLTSASPFTTLPPHSGPALLSSNTPHRRCLRPLHFPGHEMLFPQNVSSVCSNES